MAAQFLKNVLSIALGTSEQPKEPKESKELKDLLAQLNKKILSLDECETLMESLSRAGKFSLLDLLVQKNWVTKAEDLKPDLKFAYFNLGQYREILWRTTGNKTHLQDAFNLYRFSADSGLKEGQNKTGELFLFQGPIVWPEAVEQQHRHRYAEEARKMFRLAEESQDSQAKFWKARMLQGRWQNLADPIEITRHWRKLSFTAYSVLAEQNHPEACSQLGWFYEHNIIDDPTLSQEQRLRLAYQYYQKAHTLGSSLGTCRLAQLQKKHGMNFLQYGKAQNGTPSLVNESFIPEAIFKLLLSHLEKEKNKKGNIVGNHIYGSLPELYIAVAECYMEGFGVDKNLSSKERMERAYNILQTANQNIHDNFLNKEAHAGILFTLAKWHKANMEACGDPAGREKEFKTAMEFSMKAHTRWQAVDSREAAYTLFQWTENSNHTKEERRKWLEYAAEGGHPQAILAAIAHFQEAAKGVDLKSKAEGDLERRNKYLKRAYPFIKSGRLQNTGIAEMDLKVFEDNLSAELAVERALMMTLQSALMGDNLFSKFKEFSRLHDEVFPKKPQDALQETKISAESKAKLEQLKMELVTQLKEVYENFKTKNLELFRVFSSQKENTHKLNKVSIPSFLNADSCIKEVMSIALQNQFGFEAFLMITHPRGGADSGLQKARANSSIYDRKCLLLMYDLLQGSEFLKDTIPKKATIVTPSPAKEESRGEYASKT